MSESNILCVDVIVLPDQITADNVQSCYNSAGEAILSETIDIDNQYTIQDVENESHNNVSSPNEYSKKICPFCMFIISCAIIVIGILGLLKVVR